MAADSAAGTAGGLGYGAVSPVPGQASKYGLCCRGKLAPEATVVETACGLFLF